MREDLEGIRVCGLLRWAFYRSGLYRRVMKLAHRFDWHHAPVHGPIEPDGTYQRWCQWCGFRQSFTKSKLRSL